MAMFAQIDHNVVTGLLQVMSGATEFQALPPGRMMVPVDHEPKMGSTYDAATDTFTPPPVPQRTRVTKSQVVSVLTPQEWANANSSTDADVQWGMAQFNLADYVDLADPRFNQIFGALIAKGIIASTRSAQILTDLQALANA
jgi:hypothetical protein